MQWNIWPSRFNFKTSGYDTNYITRNPHYNGDTQNGVAAGSKKYAATMVAELLEAVRLMAASQNSFLDAGHVVGHL